jgi:hydrogenase maturation protease
MSILIACIGNIFLGDDGFGVAVAGALKQAGLPNGVQVIDYGIRGLDLAYALLEPWRAVILVDAISRGEQPGTLYLLRPADAEQTDLRLSRSLDPHAMDPMRMLALANSLGSVTAAIYIVGCEPADFGDELEGRMELSPQLTAAVPEAVQMVLELATKLITADVPQGAAA